MFEIELYETENGECPARDFIDSLEPKLMAKVLRTIDLLEKNGPLLKGPFSKYLGNGILELRAQQGNNISRVLYFFFAGQKIVLTNGYLKKTQKLPRGVLEKAMEYKKDYERRVI